MALDWSKEISFSGLKKGKAKTKSEYPSKTYMNLTVVKKSTTDRKRVILLAIVLVAAIALVAKFGVFDLYDRVNQAESELAQHRSVLNELNTRLSGYDELLEEYESYDTEHLSADAATVSAKDAMDLVDRVVVPHALVGQVNLAGNVLTLSVTDINLDSTGALVSLLYKEPIVSSVAVSTATTANRDASDVTTTMTINLQREE